MDGRFLSEYNSIVPILLPTSPRPNSLRLFMLHLISRFYPLVCSLH